MKYQRQENDKAFRWVSLSTMTVGKFQDFVVPVGREIEQKSEGYVLEVQYNNGKTMVIAPEKKPAYYRIQGTTLKLFKGYPLERTYLLFNDDSTPYKFPERKSNDEVNLIFKKAENAELCGDKYFTAAYNIIRNF